MDKLGLFTVSYEGYLTISATDQDSAFDIANTILSDYGILNDGDAGQWELTEIENLNYWSN
tara:strand:- start:217 stop:399 length:183 start_codon:yes stop_codon:yes gene_type:complete